jgi:hypothetical protein
MSLVDKKTRNATKKLENLGTYEVW